MCINTELKSLGISPCFFLPCWTSLNPAPTKVGSPRVMMCLSYRTLLLILLSTQSSCFPAAHPETHTEPVTLFVSVVSVRNMCALGMSLNMFSSHVHAKSDMSRTQKLCGSVMIVTSAREVVCSMLLVCLFTGLGQNYRFS